jgi:hypothetical protein
MHYASYNLPFSYTLSRFTWKSKKSLNSGVKSVLQARRDFDLLSSLALYSPEPKKTPWYQAVLCIQNIRSRKRAFIVLKKEKFCSNISPGFWSHCALVGILGHLLLSCINLCIYINFQDLTNPPLQRVIEVCRTLLIATSLENFLSQIYIYWHGIIIHYEFHSCCYWSFGHHIFL